MINDVAQRTTQTVQDGEQTARENVCQKPAGSSRRLRKEGLTLSVSI